MTLPDDALDPVDLPDRLDAALQHGEERALVALVRRVLARDEAHVRRHPSKLLTLGRVESCEELDLPDLLRRHHALGIRESAMCMPNPTAESRRVRRQQYLLSALACVSWQTDLLCPLHRRDRAPEGPGRRGRVEYPRPRAGRRRLHRGLGVAQPRRVLPGPGGHRRVPAAQVGARARLPAAQGALVLHRRPHLGALRVRVARQRRAVVAQPRQRALEFDEHGLMRRRDASINDYRIDEHERRVHPR